MDFESQIIVMAKEILQKVNDFVQKNKGDDDKQYKFAFLRLPDGREMKVPLNMIGVADAKIWNYNWNEKYQRGSGDSFSILDTATNGFFVYINRYYLDQPDFCYSVHDLESGKQKLTEDQIDLIRAYMAKLYVQVDMLQYDKEKTHSISNLTFEAKREYNKQQFNKEMDNLLQSDPTKKYLPSVEAAVDWWVEQFTGGKLGGSLGDDFHSRLTMMLLDQHFSETYITEKQIMDFRTILSEMLMERLRKGSEPELDVDYAPCGILADAMEKAGFRSMFAPPKTRMIVEANCVSVSAGYQCPYEKIYFKENQEEMYSEEDKTEEEKGRGIKGA